MTCLQPVEPLLFNLTAVPDAAKVATDDEVIVFGQAPLLAECHRAEPAEITVGVTGHKNCHLFSPSLFIVILARAPHWSL